jgi:hypothetical protein
MAKRRFKTRTVFRTAKRKSYGKGSSGVKPEQIIIPSLIYGAVREKASNMLTPITSKVPMGNIADELVLGTISYFLAKKGKGMVKQIGIAGLTIESARLGEAIADGSIMGNSSSKSTNGYVYG